MTLFDLLCDGFFAAVAAVGFGAISNPPRRAFSGIALLAAVGHALRLFLMETWHADIATASLIASIVVGVGSLFIGERCRCPITVLFIPALLPMIPGMYAYKTVFAMIMFMQSLDNAQLSPIYLQELLRNGLVTCSVLFMLAVGAAAPIFLFNKRAYSLTRRRN